MAYAVRGLETAVEKRGLNNLITILGTIMKKCIKCGKETDMPFHTCSGQIIPNDDQMREAVKLYESILTQGYQDGEWIAELARLIAARDEVDKANAMVSELKRLADALPQFTGHIGRCSAYTTTGACSCGRDAAIAAYLGIRI